MRRIVEQRVPERAVASPIYFVDGAQFLQDHVGHWREVFVQKVRQFDRGEPFGQHVVNRRMSQNITVRSRCCPPSCRFSGCSARPRDDQPANEAAERRADLVYLLTPRRTAARRPQEDQTRRQAGRNGIQQDAMAREGGPAHIGQHGRRPRSPAAPSKRRQANGRESPQQESAKPATSSRRSPVGPAAACARSICSTSCACASTPGVDGSSGVATMSFSILAMQRR